MYIFINYVYYTVKLYNYSKKNIFFIYSIRLYDPTVNIPNTLLLIFIDNDLES